VRRFNLKEKDNVLLCFHERDDGELHIMVETLPDQN
jgi:hypothetical protein